MSLINQMLKDLESRRTPDPAIQGMLAGTSNSSRKGGQQGLLIGLIAVIAALAATMGYLLWQQEKDASAAAPRVNPALSGAAPQKTAKPNSAITLARPDTPSPSATTKPEQPVLVRKHTSANDSQTQPTTAAGMTYPNEATTTKNSEPTRQRPVATSTPSRQEMLDEGAESGRIEKRIRPLRPSQIAEQRYQEGYALLQNGNQRGAEEKWRKALETDPAHIASREALSALYFSQARRVEAAEQLKQGLNYHPGNGQFALLYSRLLLENGDNAAAIATMEHAIKEQDQNADFHAFLAAIYQRQGEYDKSIAAYQRALSQQPHQSVWWLGIGISLERAGKPKEALTAYTEAKNNGRLSPKLLEYVESRMAELE